jgi:hypothetical protein
MGKAKRLNQEADIDRRRETHFRLSSRLAQMSGQELDVLFSRHSKRVQGWGANLVIQVSGTKVFVKRIPVTDLEYSNQHSTKNHYNLPTYYNYGVGSAGLGVFRELSAVVKTTNWVLSGQAENFPLLYHYRIVPISGKGSKWEIDDLEEYVRYWNNSQSIRRYVQDRMDAKFEVLMFMEFVPHMLTDWLEDHMASLDDVLEKAKEPIAFLKKNGIIHFDCHYWNLMTDGNRIYVSDFGLVLDRTFDLSPKEKAFYKDNRNYDAGQFLSCLGNYVFTLYLRLSTSRRKVVAERYGIGSELSYHEVIARLLENLDSIYVDGSMSLHKCYYDSYHRYREIVELMMDFYRTLSRNKRKNTRLPHSKFTRLLHESGFVG